MAQLLFICALLVDERLDLLFLCGNFSDALRGRLLSLFQTGKFRRQNRQPFLLFGFISANRAELFAQTSLILS